MPPGNFPTFSKLVHPEPAPRRAWADGVAYSFGDVGRSRREFSCRWWFLGCLVVPPGALRLRGSGSSDGGVPGSAG